MSRGINTADVGHVSIVLGQVACDRYGVPVSAVGRGGFLSDNRLTTKELRSGDLRSLIACFAAGWIEGIAPELGYAEGCVKGKARLRYFPSLRPGLEPDDVLEAADLEGATSRFGVEASRERETNARKPLLLRVLPRIGGLAAEKLRAPRVLHVADEARDGTGTRKSGIAQAELLHRIVSERRAYRLAISRVDGPNVVLHEARRSPGRLAIGLSAARCKRQAQCEEKDDRNAAHDLICIGRSPWSLNPPFSSLHMELTIVGLEVTGSRANENAWHLWLFSDRTWVVPSRCQRRRLSILSLNPRPPVCKAESTHPDISFIRFRQSLYLCGLRASCRTGRRKQMKRFLHPFP